MTAGRWRAAGWRVWTVAAGVVAVLLGLAGPAWAHAGGGPPASNWYSTVTSVRPVMPGVELRILPGGDGVEVRNDSDVELGVLGYDGEPYLRIGPDGVFENTRSASTRLHGSTGEHSERGEHGGGADSEPAPGSEPGSEPDPAAQPRWEQVSDEPEHRWHDHRTHWGPADLPPVVDADPGSRHLVWEWSMRLRYGTTPVTVTGELWWIPGPSPWPWYALAVALAAGAAATGMLQRWRVPVTVAVLGLLAADVAHTVTEGLPGGAFEVAWELAPTVLAWALATVALVGIRRRRTFAPHLVALAAAVIAVLSGLGDLGLLSHSQLPVTGPDWLARLCVATALGLGGGLVLAGWRIWRREQPLPPRTRQPAETGSAGQPSPADAADVAGTAGT